MEKIKIVHCPTYEKDDWYIKGCKELKNYFDEIGLETLDGSVKKYIYFIENSEWTVRFTPIGVKRYEISFEEFVIKHKKEEVKMSTEKKILWNEITPDTNLGDIEFLRYHPLILQAIQERSRDQCLNPFIRCYSADTSSGGFDWDSNLNLNDIKNDPGIFYIKNHDIKYKFNIGVKLRIFKSGFGADITSVNQTVTVIERGMYLLGPGYRVTAPSVGYTNSDNGDYNCMVGEETFLSLIEEDKKPSPSSTGEKKILVDTIGRKVIKASEVTSDTNLGEINFLKNHPKILLRIEELSRYKCLNPFIINSYVDSLQGGFSWSSSPEGFNFWENIFKNRLTEVFYNKYKVSPTLDTPIFKDPLKNYEVCREKAIKDLGEEPKLNLKRRIIKLSRSE